MVKRTELITVVLLAIFLFLGAVSIGKGVDKRLAALETKVSRLGINLGMLNEQIGTEYGPSVMESEQIKHFIELKAKVAECCNE